MNIKRVKFQPKLLPFEGWQNYNRRVAAYARVSTDSVEQGASLEAQRDYYDQYIRSHPHWIFVEIYYDRGISGLSCRNRDGFNRMIEDALEGKIDLIITKSLSRFARNTVDTLTTVRKLKAAGVEVFFEKENIYTMDSKGEFLITLLSSLAQEESRSISENITWGQRKRFADGRYSVPYRRFLGYERAGTNKLAVNTDEAKIVKLIYWLFLAGKTDQAICRYLDARCIPSPSGKRRWHPNVVHSILSNEKYKGDALLQKQFTVDFLSKRMKKNEGELPKFYVTKGHQPIVSDEVFELVQAERSRRTVFDGRYSCKQQLSSKLFCGGCGSFYGQKIAHSNDKYRNHFWRCNSFYTPGFHAPKLHDEMLRDCCQKALLFLYDRYSYVVEDCAKLLHECIPEYSTAECRLQLESVLQRAYSYEFYDEKIWAGLFEHIEVSLEGTLDFHYIDGTALVSMR